jgi:hypothetical protein
LGQKRFNPAFYQVVYPKACLAGLQKMDYSNIKIKLGCLKFEWDTLANAKKGVEFNVIIIMGW